MPARLGVVALLLALCGFAATSSPGTGDYVTHGPVAGDNPAPAVMALLHGDLARFVHLQPVMGLTSILLRLPAAALAQAAGSGDGLAYRLGAFLCLLPLALAAAWLLRDRCEPRVPVAATVLAGALLIAGPLTLEAIASGHPEEPLAAALAAAAVFAAQRGAGTSAALLLALGISTKQWALVALVPALLTLPSGRVRLVVLTAALAAPLTLLLPLLDPGAFSRADRAVSGIHFANVISVWWLLGHGLGHGLHGTARALPAGLDRGRTLAVGLGAASLASLAVSRRKRGASAGRPLSALALLALLALLRASLDPAPQEYYYLGALAALAGWEVLEARRWPLAAVLFSLAVHGLFRLDSSLAAGEVNLLALGLSLAAVAYLWQCATAASPGGRGSTSAVPAPIHLA